MTAPVLIDAFCKAGGATKGYQRAGFYVIGVDIEPQPNYCGDEFVQADALHFIAEHWRRADAIHASPPCQRYSLMSQCRPGLAAGYPDLIGPTRGLLELTGLPYVIENVPGSPLRDPVMLCGQMVGLDLYRHRLFESNVFLWQPEHPRHVKPASRAGHWTPGTVMSVSGHVSPMWKAREAMGGVDWMNRAELAEAIPAQYAELIGAQLLAHIAAEARVAA